MGSLRQYCDMLVRSGLLQELDQFKQLLEITIRSQRNPGPTMYQPEGNRK